MDFINFTSNQMFLYLSLISYLFSLTHTHQIAHTFRYHPFNIYHHLLLLLNASTEGGEDLEGGVNFLYPLHRSVQARMSIIMTMSPYTPPEAELKIDHGYHGDDDGDDEWMH